MSQYPYFEVLSYDDPEERLKWKSICQSFKDIDIFYYPEYVHLFEVRGEGKARCFVYYDDNGTVIFPFLIRQINELECFRDISDNMIDITSPYGYGGYLRNNDLVDMDKFYEVLSNYCKENNIVSEFVRFHPLLNNSLYSPEGVDTHLINETVIIDLTLTPEEIWGKLAVSCRNKVKKANKLGVQVFIDENFENLDKFHELYVNTMERLRAQQYYYFTIEWFHNLIESLKGNVVLFYAVYRNNIIISGAFLFTGEYIHYYLSGSDYRMSHLAANNLLLYEVALWAKERGIKLFHLGGGYQPGDSLFKFKASFSPLKSQFYIGNIIHDLEYYQYLCARKQVGEGKILADPSFFPSYRAPVKDISPYTAIKGRTIIIGASGHARVCLDILVAQKKDIIGFWDDDTELIGCSLHDYQVVGNIKSLIPFLLESELDYIIAIGDNCDRRKIALLLQTYLKRQPINIIHPSTIISPRTIMGYGNFIAPGVIINTDTKIGSYTIINTGATVDHDNVIHDFAQISPGCNLAGNVILEEGAFIGTGAIVIPGKTIGAYAIIGAGAVVIHDIPPFSTAVGVPARVIKQKLSTDAVRVK
jgi:sugar O-acyltransferase (sialic acid O-acetyltransferase NeuD family)